MDNLIVDLDKVLDDFEAEESTPKIPGQEITPSDYAYYVAKNEDKPWDDMSRGPITSAPTWNMYQNDDFVKTVSYDIPYTPVDNFDLSEADFAPKIGVDEKQTYTGPLDTVDNGVETEHDKIYIEQKEYSLDDKVVNGNLNGLHHNNDSFDNDYSYTIKPKPVLIESVDLSNSYINDTHSVEDNAIDIHSEGVSQNANINNGIETDSTVKHLSDNDSTFKRLSDNDSTVKHLSDNHNHLDQHLPGNIYAVADQTSLVQSQSFQEDFKYPVQVVDKFTPVSPEKKFIPNTLQVSQEPSRKQGDNSVYNIEGNFQGTSSTTSYATQNKNEIDHAKNSLEKQVPKCENSFSMEKNSDEMDKVLNHCVESSQDIGGSMLEGGITSVGNDNVTSDYSDGKIKSESLSETEKCENVIESAGSGDGHKITESNNTVQSAISTQQTTNISGNDVIGFAQDDSDNDSGLSEHEVDTYLKQIKDENEIKGSSEDVKSDLVITDNVPLVKEAKTEEFENSEDMNIHGTSEDKMSSALSIQQTDNTQHGLSKTDIHDSNVDQTGLNTDMCNKTDLISGTNIPDIVRSSNESSPQRQITDGSVETERSQDSPRLSSSPVSGGARPKEPVLRPSSLMGLSKVSLEFDGNRSARHIMPSPTRQQNTLGLQNDSSLNGLDLTMKQNQNVQNDISQPNISDIAEQRTMQNSDFDNDQSDDLLGIVSDTVNTTDDGEIPVMRRAPQDGRLILPGQAASQSNDSSRPHSWGPSGSASSGVQQQKRPNSLNIPPRGFGAERSNMPSRGFGAERSHVPYTFPYDGVDENGSTDTETPESAVPVVGEEDEEYEKDGDVPSVDEVSGAAGSTPSPEASLPESPIVPSHSENVLGKVAPRWIPDAEAPTCMGCDLKFTFTKRRHHCRACGKVFCSQCCNMKNRLPYMDNKEVRVCQSCHQQLAIAEISSRTGRSPNPNNPSEYCTTIPPSQQANARSPPPTVMVPVVGVLKREGSHKKGEPKQVMFSDGIRPGGDLTELDGSDQVNRIMPRRTSRLHKKVERTPTPAEVTHQPIVRRIKTGESRKSKCLIPDVGLPPLVVSSENEGDYSLEENPNPEKFMPQIKDEEAEPVIFAVNANLLVMVKILNLDCCVNRICWCFTSKGMCTVGQDEVVIVLEIIPDEKTVPRDIFCHFQSLYDEAGKGNTVSNMGHSIFNDNFLDSKDHGGMLYICPTFQCLHKLMIPSPPYVFGILLQKWEVPWAKVFPIRLLLRLGAEYRYYPCPLISVRYRKPIFFEIGHTIMNLLADFRNYQYMLPQIKGVTIHMEDKKTIINFPRNRYDELMKVVSSSNEHVMAVGASFSSDADSHLVCIQNDEGNYQTQAINIQNKPRKVTGASFVVFNGALKTSSGLKAKSSIVEDGLMVQITPDNMAALKQAMKDMMDYKIGCGSVNIPTPDEEVIIQWVEDDKNVNVGVKSPIDNLPMDGIESIHIPNATDYMGENRVIRWTDVFFIQNEDTGSAREPVDLSRLAETLSNAACIALASHLDKLKDASLMKIGLRVTIESEKVGYEIGASGEKLPDFYMNDLDNELIPVIHSAASQTNGGAICLELIFHILE